MATETNDLQIVIQAVNKASEDLKKVSNDLAGLSDGAKKAGNASKEAGAGASLASLNFKSMALAVGVGTIAADLAAKALSALVDVLKQAVAEAANSELAWVRVDATLLNVSKTSGIVFSQLKKATEEAGMAAIRMGYSGEEAGQGMAQLLLITKDLEQSQQLLSLAMDYSAKTGESLSGSVRTMSLAYQGFGRLLRSEGVDLDENTSKVEILKRMTDAFGGMQEKVGDTTTYSWKRVSTSIGEAIEILGKPINNQLGVIAKDLQKMFERNAYLAPMIGKALESWAVIIKFIFAIVRTVAGAFEAILTTVLALTKATGELVRLNIQGAKETGSNWLNAMGQINNSMNDAMLSVGQTQSETLDTMYDDQAEFVASVSDKQKKMGEDLAKAYEKYMHDVENANKEYKSQLESLVIAHREAYKQINKDIKEENTAFKNTTEDMAKDFNKAMRDIEQSHAQKTKSILSDMESERRAYQNEIDSINSEWNALTSLTEGAGQDRLNNLQAQLSKELALGDNADREKVSSLEEMISREKEALAKAIADQQTLQAEEITKATETKDAKITALEGELATEEAMYSQAVSDRKSQYDEDLANAKATHDAKLKDLKEKLAEENDIRKKYAEDFKKVGEKAALDDITTLKNKHEETLKEMRYQYEQQTKDLQTALEAENKIRSEAQAKADKTRLEQVEKTARAEAGILKKYGLEQNQSFGGYSSNIPSFLQPNYGLSGFAEGGLVTKPSIVGEKGYPEVVLPLNEPQRMAEILKGLGIQGGGGGNKIEQNFYVTVNNQADVDMIMERASFKAKYL